MTDTIQRSILAVDDDEAVTAALAVCLGREGCGVEAVVSGREALARIGNGPLDLVLLDETIPDMDSRAVLDEIRKTHSAADLPVIMLAEAADGIAGALAAGANDRIAKPIDDALLCARVKTHLGLKDAAQGLEAANRTIEEQAEHLQMVMDSATISIFSLNIEGKITSANQMTAEMTGRPVADLIGASFAGLIDSDDPAEAEALVAKVIEDGYFVSNHEATVRRPDASVRIIILSLRALTRDGDITGVAGIANDVTELRQQRKALSAYLRMLETPDPTLLSLMVRESPGLPAESAAQTAVAEAADDAANLVQMDKQEHRSHPRFKVYKGGKISFNNETSIVDCVVRNLSEGGARLQFPSHFDCPRFVVLRISGGNAYNCEVRQFANNIMGVKFLGEHVSL